MSYAVRRKTPLALICGILTLLALPGRGHAEEAAKPLLYGIPVGPPSAFWNEAGDGARQAAKELGYDIIYRGAPQLDLEGQRRLFDIALKSGAKGIFIAPNTPERAEDLARAKAAGIPVVYFDRTMGKTDDLASFIGTDNFAGGKLAAEELVKKAGKDAKLKVVVFRMDRNVVPTTERERGFIEGVTAAGYEVVASPEVSSEVGEARSRIRKFLADPATPKFSAVFTPAEYVAVATVLTLQELGKTRDYIHIGFDSGDVIEKAIQSGDMYGTIVQQPYQMGYQSVKALDAVLHGKAVRPWIVSDAKFVSAENTGGK